MKRFLTILAISTFMIIAVPAISPVIQHDLAWACEEPGCVDGCDNGGCFTGEFSQTTWAGKSAGNVVTDEDGNITVNNGAFAAAGETGGGSFEGELSECPYCDSWGVGAVASLGFSYAFAEDSELEATAAAATGDLTIGALLGQNLAASCLRIEGDGSHVSLALKKGTLAGEWAVLGYAKTTGDFDYNVSTSLPNSLLIGGGLTGGVSNVRLTDHSVTSIAGGGTVSGAGRFKINN
jgi:hypothetical protein